MIDLKINQYKNLLKISPEHSLGRSLVHQKVNQSIKKKSESKKSRARIGVFAFSSKNH